MKAITDNGGQPSDPASLFHPDNMLQLELAAFNKQLSKDPPVNDLVTRTFKQWDAKLKKQIDVDYYYLPIGLVENKLMEIFGWFETKNFQTQIVANEILGSIELHVYHPVFKRMVCSVGTAAVMITQKSGSPNSDIDAKIKNALETAAPHLMSDCIANAAKRFGPAFGRDLNRGFTQQYAPEIMNSLERLEQMEQERVRLERSAKVLLEAQQLINQYTDAAKLFNEARGIADNAIKRGLLENDLDSLRAFFTAKRDTLLAQKQLPEAEQEQPESKKRSSSPKKGKQ